jgi:hypothetical protein
VDVFNKLLNCRTFELFAFNVEKYYKIIEGEYYVRKYKRKYVGRKA